jgi:heme a synthase
VTQTAPQHESSWPHRLAVLLCCATFPLIWVGGLVTSHDAGMAVYDWPTTFGYNMFRYPWQNWLFGPFDIFVEHGHRLLGAVVGVITIGFVLAVFLRDCRLWMRFAAIAALALVIGQGSLGGLRVLLNERQLAQLHGCIGPLFFAYTASLAVMTSRLWRESQTNLTSAPHSPLPSPLNQSVPRKANQSTADPKLIRFGWITVGLVYLQLVLGSFLRHGSATATRDQFRLFVVFHLLVAVVVTVHLLLWFRRAAGHRPFGSHLKWPARGLAALIVVQVGLGLATWVVNYGWPIWLQSFEFAASFRIQAGGMLQSLVVTGHVANGSLLLATSTTLATRQSRLLRDASPAVAAKHSATTFKGVLA